MDCDKFAYNRARGRLVQEFTDSPDVMKMTESVFEGFCDLYIHSYVRVKNNTQVSN